MKNVFYLVPLLLILVLTLWVMNLEKRHAILFDTVIKLAETQQRIDTSQTESIKGLLQILTGEKP